MKRVFLTALAAMASFVATAPAPAQTASQINRTTFNLAVNNPKLESCIADSSGIAPTATVTVLRGELNDVLVLSAHHIKPNLAFDMFTVQNSSLLANSQPDPAFKNFGLAWYQSDVQANSNGEAQVVIRTILLDQIFGFDPVVALPPTNTFHVGFWFNNPHDAAACGFNPDKPTPFNGEHKAGPLAMISLPNAETNLGPLCTNPVLSNGKFVCHP